MTRSRYALYVGRRIGEALSIALGAATLAYFLQRLNILPPFQGLRVLVGRASPGRTSSLLAGVGWWTWPLAWAAAGHLVLGPKQRKPVYLRIPGAMYAYAGIKVDRNAGCRGGCITGATGSGKTLACIVPRLHSLCINEAGIEHREWRGSPAQRDLARLKENHRARGVRGKEDMERLGVARRAAEGRRAAALADAVSGPRVTESPASPDEVDAVEEKLGELRRLHDRETEALQRACDATRTAHYAVPPWGGFICGEKGNEWQLAESILFLHGRDEDLCLLRTRPSWAPRDWSPSVRYNLLSNDEVPADTYAKIIVDSGLAVEEADHPDDFFVPQARDKIAWGLRLVRAVREAAKSTPLTGAIAELGPSLLTLLEILTVQESYRQFLLGATARHAGLSMSPAFAEARYQLENNYWNQPPDQLGGVRSTLYNFLIPFAEPEIAEVFCATSTFDLRDIQKGKVVCLSIPQKFALQRRYVATFLKTMVYHIVLERFDRRADHPEWLNRNVILVEQDEWQRHAVRADCEVDVVREARGAVYAATQSQNAVWLKLGGRENAAPLIANLRNRWICQAASEECADESSKLVSGRMSRELSYSRGTGGNTTTVSFAERPFLPRRELRTLPPFHVVFAPAEGPWLYRTCIAMPAAPDGTIPPWWFGDWNPLHWIGHALKLPEKIGPLALHPGERFIPPWRASAPLRAQIRRLCGLDGTFIITGGRRSGDTR